MALAVLCSAGLRRISAVASRPSAVACLLLMPQGCPVWNTTRIGPWTDSVLTLHAELSWPIEHHDLHPHMYVDDTHIYGFCHQTKASQLQRQLSACIDDIALWMQSNQLQLNTAKTEDLCCASGWWQHQLPQVALKVGTNYIMPTTSVRDLGICVDSDMSMWTHMSRTMSGCFSVLCQLCSICRSTSPAVLLSLVVSLVLSLCGLWQRNARRSAWQSAQQTTVCNERRCTTCLICAEVRAHHPATPWPSLAAGARADRV